MFGHTVRIEPYLGPGAGGPVYGPAVAVACRINAGHRLVRRPESAEDTDDTVIYLAAGVQCPLQSRVTLPDGSTATVMRVVARDAGRRPSPAHQEVTVQ